jgi:hypothetical protein
MRRAFCAVAVLALACLLVRAARVGLAGDYVDPISKISAQDEALYASSSIRMAHGGGWLTPRFMGRLALYKPPLLMWLSGLSARILGVSALALRLPVALLCCLSAGLVFLWAAEIRSPAAGLCAAGLLVSNHLWHVLGSLAMTDGLLVAFYTAALYCLFSDPWLESRRALWGFAASVAAAILTKSVAGVLPLGVLGLYWLVAPRNRRPTLAHACLAAALSIALAAPWFVYQAIVHPRWFWAEHIAVEILGYGAGAPPQTSRESQLLFYLMRLPLTDPMLTAVALVAVPAFVVALRRKSAEAVLLLCWIAVTIAAIFAFQYRNISYLLPLIPALAILAAGYSPRGAERALAIFVAGAFLLKAAQPQAPWGVSFARDTIQKNASLISAYCERGRGNELIVVGLDDDLYASTLPLARLRYGLVGAVPEDTRYGMKFREMGITLTAEEFDDMGRWAPIFRRRLGEWDRDSDDPIGTLIVARSPAELAAIIRAHPGSDFFIPDAFRRAVERAPGHELIGAGGHFFLLSKQEKPRPSPPAWACAL